jgi:hypothetical protein
LENSGGLRLVGDDAAALRHSSNTFEAQRLVSLSPARKIGNAVNKKSKELGNLWQAEWLAKT